LSLLVAVVNQRLGFLGFLELGAARVFNTAILVRVTWATDKAFLPEPCSLIEFKSINTSYSFLIISVFKNICNK
jgi:hypothetical protein